MALQGIFGLEFFLVLEALLFLFTCYQVVKAGRILDEIQDKLSEVKRGERVGAKRKHGAFLRSAPPHLYFLVTTS